MRNKEIYVCPYKNEEECPNGCIQSFDKFGRMIFPVACYKGPLIENEKQTSVCRIAVDLDNPGINKAIVDLPKHFKWRKGG